jgi:hypothetical protein
MREPITRPLTERQQQIVAFLAENPRSTPADIAYGIGITRGPMRRRGPWSGYMSPAQHVIGSLNGLGRRGLITFARRRDGLSGTAYSLTRETWAR